MTANLVKITNHVDEALSRLLYQYKDAQKLKALISSITQEIQRLEETLFQNYELRNIYTATGKQLDMLGTIVDEPRLSRADEDYRLALLVKVLINTSQGEPPLIIRMAQSATKSEHVHYINLYDAECQLGITKTYPTLTEQNTLVMLLSRVFAAGVRLSYVSSYDASQSFAYDGSQAAATALGYDDGTNAVGGKYADVYELMLPFAYDGNNPNYLGYGSEKDPLAGGIYINNL